MQNAWRTDRHILRGKKERCKIGADEKGDSVQKSFDLSDLMDTSRVEPLLLWQNYV